jgi:site-specific DNA-cytosine methylase
MVPVGKDAWDFEHEGPARRLSLEECALLQGFPNAYRYVKALERPGSARAALRDAFLAVGNAVPRPLLRAIAEAIPNVW